MVHAEVDALFQIASDKIVINVQKAGVRENSFVIPITTALLQIRMVIPTKR